MKKAAAAVTAFFLVIFCVLSIFKEEINNHFYSLMYLRDEATLETDGEMHSVLLKEGDKIAFGSCFGEPIIWTVLEAEENALIFADKAVCMRAFDGESSDWKSSDLREWLNGEFLSGGNFTSAQKALLADGGDKIFLLSKQELSNIPQKERARGLTASAVENAPSDKLIVRRNVWYWTSSSIDTNSVSVAAVNQGGGFYKTLAYDALMGVCPAAHITAEVMACGGDGTEKRPYVISD